jgi:hypothetical protein
MKTRGIYEMNGEAERLSPRGMTRRTFVGWAAGGLAALAAGDRLRGRTSLGAAPLQAPLRSEIRTNIDEILKIPRTSASMPGKFPGRVVKVLTGDTASAGKINGRRARACLEKGLMQLTGRNTPGEAWREFVVPADIVGIKVNPIARFLPTSFALTQAVIDGLKDAGVPASNIAIWDRRLFQLEEAGYTSARFPGISVLGTEIKGPNGDFYNEKGELWSLANIDRDAPAYFADIDDTHDREDLPYMVNGGKWSYFSRLVTQRFTKIINLPILKTCQPVGISFALKNLAYGSLSNTSRLHRVGVNVIGEACAFPCLRDKAVLHIGDALRASYSGGLGGNPKYTWDANILFVGTDPVSVDLVTLEYITGIRIARGVQEREDRQNRIYLDIAAELGLGVADRTKIDLLELSAQDPSDLPASQGSSSCVRIPQD